MSLNEPVTNPTVVATLSSTLQHALSISSTNAEILVSVLIFSIIGIVGWISYIIINRYVNKYIEKTTTTLDKEIAKTIKTVIKILIGVLALQFSLSPLSFLEPYKHTLDSVFLILQIMLTAYAVTKVTNILIDELAQRSTQKSERNKRHSSFILKKIVAVAVFIIAFIIILNQLELTGAWETTIAGLGISGIVIAFALQSTLSDFFSAFAIYLDRPFEIGDFIFVGEHGGTVKNIGIFTTRLQLLQGEELVVSNKELTSTYVRNFRKLQKRRIVFNIGVTYDTPNEKLRKIPPMIVDIIKSVKGTSPQFVNFNEFGEYSLKFFVSYFVSASDYGKYLEVQQEINLAIREAFEREGIEMAYLKNVTFIKR
ncbi:MAG: mechanosensitive ion channel family protein [Candidatus Bathyarchaeota archaeon]|nr:mechanosensitive ion channel family protein [Candidatus Termiticorpusculum sp.]